MSVQSAIVLVTTSYPRAGDGSEAAGAFVLDLAEEIAKHMPVRVVAPGDANRREPGPGGIEVFRFAAPAEALSTLKPWHPFDLLKIHRVLGTGLDATRQAVKAGPTASVLALWALPSGAWARRAAREARLPYSVWTLGSDIWSLGRIPVVRTWMRAVLSQAQQCFSDGLRLAEDTRRIAGRNVEFLPSTRKIAGHRPGALRGKGPYRLLFLGRWHVNKGVDLLLEALELLGEEDWASVESMTICGGGPLEPVVRQGVASLQAAGRPVILQGYLTKQAAEQAILSADYLVIPSRVESIPVVFSDAAKLGCAVLACPVGDLPALVAGSPPAGLVADEVSGSGIARMISRALERRPDEFAEGLVAVADKFDLAGIAARIAGEARGKP